MPTENRSSNTDPRDVFIRLNPLGLCEAELRKDSTGFKDQRTHSDYLLFLAGYRETHPEPLQHPEPIAWMVGTAFWWTKEEAERDAEATGLPVTPVGPITESGKPAEQHQGDPVAWLAKTLKGSLAGTLGLARYDQRLNPELYEGPFPVFRHADPGEVERLRKELKAAIHGGVKEEVFDIVCKERDALRAQLVERDALLHEVSISPDWSLSVDLQVRISDALSASAEPSAQVTAEVEQ